jgi:cephalosporin hydroxylase
MHPKITEFFEEKAENIKQIAESQQLKELGLSFLIQSGGKKYSYNFTWFGVPIIQFPQDIVALQEVIWKAKPDLIIETGVAHGGSLIFLASLLEAIGGAGEVLGIDIDIRPHNRAVIEQHPLFKRIKLIEGSSIDNEIVNQVREIAKHKQRVLVILDSNHTHEHVMQELNFYSPWVSVGSYCIVFDTAIEDMPENSFPNRPWDKGNNPKTAVWEFLKTNPNFEIDRETNDKLLITVAPDGYLKRIK